MDMPRVHNCAATNCSFNHDGCNALAMTMGQKGCVTFVEIGVRSSEHTTAGQVGACQRADCTFNHNLECSAESVKVGANGADCLTYKVA